MAAALVSSSAVSATTTSSRSAHPYIARGIPPSSHEPRIVTGTDTSASRDAFGLRSNAISMIAASRHVARNAGSDTSDDAIASYTDGRSAHKDAHSTTPQAISYNQDEAFSARKTPGAIRHRASSAVHPGGGGGGVVKTNCVRSTPSVSTTRGSLTIAPRCVRDVLSSA